MNTSCAALPLGRVAFVSLLLLALAGCASEPVFLPPSTNATPSDSPPAEVSIVFPSELFVKVNAVATAATTMDDFDSLRVLAAAKPDFAPAIAATAIQTVLGKTDNADNVRKITMIVQMVVMGAPSNASEIVTACNQVVPDRLKGKTVITRDNFWAGDPVLEL